MISENNCSGFNEELSPYEEHIGQIERYEAAFRDFDRIFRALEDCYRRGPGNCFKDLNRIKEDANALYVNFCFIHGDFVNWLERGIFAPCKPHGETQTTTPKSEPRYLKLFSYWQRLNHGKQEDLRGS